MREHGLTPNEVLSTLRQALSRDGKYADGNILCSMCTTPHPIAKTAATMFFESNLGDPGLFPGSVELEKQAVHALSELLHCPNGTGFIVSGGTEANLLALYAAREQANTTEPEVVLPDSAHFSFDKICRMLKIKPKKVALDASFRVDPASVAQLITPRTVAVVGTAGSAELGAVDPISDIAKIAQRHDVPVHVDAAFGGLVLPFLEELSYPAVGVFDFRLPAVQSVTVDPHKMGMVTVPAGGIVFRDPQKLECIKTQTPYLTREDQYTFVGTRSAAAAAATWAVFASLGREGFRQTIQQCMHLTTFLADNLKNAGFELVTPPQLNIIAFRSNSNTKQLAQKLQNHGWQISYIPRLNCIRVVIMPHTTQKHLTQFLHDLQNQ
ncbi:MAG: tyrosine decarboxylase MfnA [Candidatus Bathyarchaeota archaeon]|nr:tyrosine decarboxylase MfnA [Candidatus Bathyarchaeota archaeon]